MYSEVSIVPDEIKLLKIWNKQEIDTRIHLAH